MLTSRRIIWICALALLAALPAEAGNGHLLHGVGAVNSSLGGAGTGLAFETLGALHANPALLTQLDDLQVGISIEGFKDDLSVTTSAPGLGFPEHTTKSDGELGVLPALGWSLHQPGKKTAYGFGLLAVAGFRTNFPADKDSLLLSPFPVGFGRLATDLAVTKIPFAVAWQATPSLSLGASANLYQGRLVIQPLPVVEPDCNVQGSNSGHIPATGCFRPSTSGQVSSYATALQLGLYYQVNPVWSLGLAYTTAQNFDPYEWNSQRANPNLTSGPRKFGDPRQISIDVDGPAIASVGLGIRPNPKWKIALDARWVGYADTNGIGGPGGLDFENRLVSIGWRDIYVGMLGVEFQASPGVALRGGLNFNQSPIEDRLTLNSGGTPSVFEQHYTLGASFALAPKLGLDLGFYYTPENEKTGAFYNAGTNTNIPGTSVTLRNSILSGLVGFSFKL